MRMPPPPALDVSGDDSEQCPTNWRRRQDEEVVADADSGSAAKSRERVEMRRTPMESEYGLEIESETTEETGRGCSRGHFDFDLLRFCLPQPQSPSPRPQPRLLVVPLAVNGAILKLLLLLLLAADVVAAESVAPAEHESTALRECGSSAFAGNNTGNKANKLFLQFRYAILLLIPLVFGYIYNIHMIKPAFS